MTVQLSTSQKKEKIKGVTAANIFQLFAILNHAVSVTLSGQTVPVEKQLHLLERFESDWCTSPLVSSPAPYWAFNGHTLNDGESNTHYGVLVNRSSSLEGHHQAKLVIPSVTSAMNDSTMVCMMENLVVILEYHLIIVEPQWVHLTSTNESFQSALCVSPQVMSLAPYFTYTFENDITLNDVEINKLYNSSVNRSISSEGHHQASLTILGVNPAFNNAVITCWVKSAVILQYQLIIESSKGLTTVTDVQGDATTVATSDGTTSRSAVDMDTSVKSMSQSGLSWIAVVTCILVVLVTVIVAGVCTSLYLYRHRQGMCTKRNVHKLDSVESPCDDMSEPQQKSEPMSPHDQSHSNQTSDKSEVSLVTTQHVNGTLLHHPMPKQSDKSSVACNEDRALLDVTTNTESDASLDSSLEDKSEMSTSAILKSGDT